MTYAATVVAGLLIIVTAFCVGWVCGFITAVTHIHRQKHRNGKGATHDR